MSDGVIPEDARQFLLKNIDSIAQLEGLLVLRGDPGKAWDAAEVARHLYIGEAETTEILARLAGRGLVGEAGGKYTYAPATAELAAMVDQVADLYSRYLIAVTQFIHARPKSRVQEFANAFRIRKD